MSANLSIDCDIHLARRGHGRRVVEAGPEPDHPAVAGRVPWLMKWMALAIRCEALIREGAIENYAAIARVGQVTRARVSQIMNLLNLAPDIQEALLGLPRIESGREPVVLRDLQPIASEVDWRKQRGMWEVLTGLDVPFD